MISLRSKLPVAIVALLIGIGIAVVALRSANSHRTALLGALRRGMERTYDQAVARSLRDQATDNRLLPPDLLGEVLLESTDRAGTLPSFVNQQDVFLCGDSIQIPGDRLMFVVRVGEGQYYGITANRVWRQVQPDDLAAWSHNPLATR